MNLLPQFGLFELVLIAIVALIVVGPQDLPKLMRSAGRMMRKARELASEFTAAFDQMAREAEMEELRAEIESLKKNNVVAGVKKDLEDAVKPINDELREGARDLNAQMDTNTDKPVSEPVNEPATTADPAGPAKS